MSTRDSATSSRTWTRASWARSEVRRGRWGIILDGLYFKLRDQGARSWQGPGGIGSATGDLDVTTTMQMYQLSAAYRLGGGVPTDLIVAGRYTQLDLDLNLVATTGGLSWGARAA